MPRQPPSRQPSLNLRHSTILVTGGTSSLGYEFAIQLLARQRLAWYSSFCLTLKPRKPPLSSV